jgi:hypothetical protein
LRSAGFLFLRRCYSQRNGWSVAIMLPTTPYRLRIDVATFADRTLSLTARSQRQNGTRTNEAKTGASGLRLSVRGNNHRTENANQPSLVESRRGRRLDVLITPGADFNLATGPRNCAGFRNKALNAACRDAALNRRLEKNP